MLNLYSKEQISKLHFFIQHSKNIVILSHTNPDGDAIGSILALHNTFLTKGISSKGMVPNSFPPYYDFLHSSDQIQIASDHTQQSKDILAEADLLFALDFNSFARIAQLEEDVRNSKAKKVLIDHHISPDCQDFDLVFSQVEISSTSEYVYWILDALYTSSFLTKEIAACIYTGICTDTGSFSYSCNQPSTYQVMAQLLKSGLNCETTHGAIYNGFSENRLRLLGFSLTERMNVFSDIGAAIIYLTQEDLQKYNYQVGDTEGIVNYALSMNEIEVGVLLTEFPDKIRISFRSKGLFDTNVFARTYFQGGGHKKASGGTSYLPMTDTLALVEKLIRDTITNSK